MQQQRPRRAHRWGIGIAALGGLAAVGLGAGVLALLADSVTIEENQIVSGELDFGALDIVAGLATPGTAGCPSGTDGPVAGDVVDVSLEVQADGSVEGEASLVLCYRNVGEDAAFIQMRLDAVKAIEGETCSAGEVEVDPGCTEGQEGELVPTTVSWSGCGEANSNPFTGDGTIVWDRDIAQPGEACDDVRLTFAFEAPPETAPALQSDALVFDVVVDATEPTP